MLNIHEQYPLAPHTTLNIGGPARYFLAAHTEDDLCGGLEFAHSKSLDVFILGGGSNLVISDAGIEGLVIKIKLDNISIKSAEDNKASVTASAGVDWDGLVSKCVNGNLAGFECLSGIPGSVGGTPIQNVGAYGQEVSETIKSVRCLDRMNGQILDLDNYQCRFSYRSSIFNTTHKNRYIVLSVTFSLAAGASPQIVYKDLAEHFNGREPSVSEVRSAVLAIRRSKSMVIDESDPNSRSAGSFFKNPILDISALAGLQQEIGDIPSFPFGEGQAKIPAAWLIERAGFYKGYTRGNVGISKNHALAIVNRGNGTAAEVLALKTEIQRVVQDKFGISLIPEPIFVGFPPGVW